MSRVSSAPNRDQNKLKLWTYTASIKNICKFNNRSPKKSSSAPMLMSMFFVLQKPTKCQTVTNWLTCWRYCGSQTYSSSGVHQQVSLSSQRLILISHHLMLMAKEYLVFPVLLPLALVFCPCAPDLQTVYLYLILILVLLLFPFLILHLPPCSCSCVPSPCSGLFPLPDLLCMTLALMLTMFLRPYPTVQ